MWGYRQASIVSGSRLWCPMIAETSLLLLEWNAWKTAKFCASENPGVPNQSNFEVELTFVFGVSIPETRNLRNSNENPREKVNQKEEHFPSVIPPVFPPVFPAFSCILSSRVKNEDAWSGHGAVRTWEQEIKTCGNCVNLMYEIKDQKNGNMTHEGCKRLRWASLFVTQQFHKCAWPSMLESPANLLCFHEVELFPIFRNGLDWGAAPKVCWEIYSVMWLLRFARTPA